MDIDSSRGCMILSIPVKATYFWSKGEVNVKATGIVRKVDELGRIVLPIEMRRTLDIAEKDALEIYVEGSSVILKKYKPSCLFCDGTKDITVFKGKNVCPKCLRELREL